MLVWIKKTVKKIIFHFITPPRVEVKTSYAQAGEDVIIKFLFESKKLPLPSYLELGTFLPDIHNNTYLFYTLGSRGVCVEADSSMIDNIKKVRIADVVLNVGVGLQGSETSANFYIFDDPALNTFSEEEATYRVEHGSHKILEVKQVGLESINNIVKENFNGYPDFLSIDIESMDLLVLQSLNFDAYPIPVVCAETCTYSENHIKPKDLRISDFMQSKGYFIYADTYINTIFVNSKWFYGAQ